MLCILYSIILLGLRSQTHAAVNISFLFLWFCLIMAIYQPKNVADFVLEINCCVLTEYLVCWILIFCLSIPTSNYLCIKFHKRLWLCRNQYIFVFSHPYNLPLRQFTQCQVVISLSLWHNTENSVTGMACSHLLLLAVQQNCDYG